MSETMYEVYDTRTGEAIRRRRPPCRPLRTTSMSAAMMGICAAEESESQYHAAMVDIYEIPAGAELDVRPVRGES